MDYAYFAQQRVHPEAKDYAEDFRCRCALTDASGSAVWIGVAVVSMVLGACSAPAHSGEDAPEIYFLLPNTITARFIQQDEPMFTDFMAMFAPESTLGHGPQRPG